MTTWRYFVETNQPATAETTPAALLRLEAGDPWGMADVLHSDGQWVSTDTLVKYHLLGSNDTDITEITPERADNIVQAWVKRGRITALPTPLPSDTSDIERTTQEHLAREQRRTQSRAFQAQAEAIYHNIPTPPGAEDIQTPSANS